MNRTYGRPASVCQTAWICAGLIIGTLCVCLPAEAQHRWRRHARRAHFARAYAPVRVPAPVYVPAPRPLPVPSAPTTTPSAAVPPASGPSFPGTLHAGWMHQHMQARREMFHAMMRARYGEPRVETPTQSLPVLQAPANAPAARQPTGPPTEMVEPASKPLAPPPLPSPVQPTPGEPAPFEELPPQ